MGQVFEERIEQSFIREPRVFGGQKVYAYDMLRSVNAA